MLTLNDNPINLCHMYVTELQSRRVFDYFEKKVSYEADIEAS